MAQNVVVSLPYGKGMVEATIETGEGEGKAACVDILKPGAEGGTGAETKKEEHGYMDTDAMFKKAKEGKNDRGPFEENLSTDMLIIINDATRPTRSDILLRYMLPYIQDYDYTIMMACGSHKRPSEDEVRLLLGETYTTLRERVVFHDAKSRESCLSVGRSLRGNEFLVNRRVLEAGSVIIIGSVEPHYFAGFTGGRKAFLPGVSYYDTIERNHSLTRYKEATTLNLDTNPVHLEMEEMAEAVSAERRRRYGTAGIYSFQMVVIGEGTQSRIAGLFGGGLKESFLEAVELSKQVHCIPVPKLYDIVIAAATPPTDINLYQTQKTLENAVLACREGGVIVLLSSCRDGIGPRDFYDLMTSKSTPQEVLKAIAENYKLGYHKAGKFVEALSLRKVIMVSELKDEVLSAVGIIPASNLQDAISHAFSLHYMSLHYKTRKENPRVLVMPAGSLTTPVAMGQEQRRGNS